MRSLVAVFCAFVTVLLGQSEPKDTTAFRADSTLVLVPVSVTDPSNRYVLGLAKEDFTLFEDGVQQKVTHFANEDAPLSIGLLVDTSGSMGSKLDTSRRAVAGILKDPEQGRRSVPGGVQRSGPTGGALNQRRGGDRKRDDSATSGGLTALLDAVHVGLQEMNAPRIRARRC